MKLPSYEPKHVRWDEFQRFHTVITREHAGIDVVRFTDTDEVIAKASSTVKPDYRCIRRELDVEVWATTDTDLFDRWHIALPDGTPLTRTDVHDKGGQQLLWCDVTHGRAVRLGHYGPGPYGTPTGWPRVTEKYSVYYPRPDAIPQSSEKIRYTLPPVWQAGERAKIKEIQAAVMAWLTLSPEYGEIDKANASVRVESEEQRDALSKDAKAITGKYVSFSPNRVYLAPEIRVIDAETVLTKGFEGLTPFQRLQTVLGTVYRPRTHHTASYFIIAKRDGIA